MNTLRVVPVPPKKSIEPERTETVDRCRHLTLKRLPPHLAIGNNRQPGIFLQCNRLIYGAILDFLKLRGAENAGGELFLRGKQLRRSQHASHDIGMEDRMSRRLNSS